MKKTTIYNCEAVLPCTTDATSYNIGTELLHCYKVIMFPLISAWVWCGLFIFFFQYIHTLPSKLTRTMQHYHIVTLTFLMPADYSACFAKGQLVYFPSKHLLVHVSDDTRRVFLRQVGVSHSHLQSLVT